MSTTIGTLIVSEANVPEVEPNPIPACPVAPVVRVLGTKENPPVNIKVLEALVVDEIKLHVALLNTDP
jgi:hypothetical protein